MNANSHCLLSIKGTRLDTGYRVDLLVEQRIVIELKAVETLTPLHRAQLMTYMKLLKCPLGLLLNFNVPILKDGIVRLSLGAPNL